MLTVALMKKQIGGKLDYSEGDKKSFFQRDDTCRKNWGDHNFTLKIIRKSSLSFWKYTQTTLPTWLDIVLVLGMVLVRLL